MTVEDLAAWLSHVGAEAFVVHRFEGQWMAGIRTRAGLKGPVHGDNAVDSIEKLMEKVTPWTCSCGQRFATMDDINAHATPLGGITHGDV